MAFTILTKDEFQKHCQSATECSFLQSLEMAELLTKRGFDITYVGWKKGDTTSVSAILYSKAMTGGLHMEINAGPVITDESDLSPFYQGLIKYAKKNKCLQLLVKPYQTYQTFDSDGQPTSPERRELINQLTQLGFQHDGLKTGYPGGEPDWHYVKDLTGLDKENLLKSFNKNSIRNIKNAQQLGITVRHISLTEVADFKNVIEETGERQGFQDKDLAYYQNLYRIFDGKCSFLVAELNPQQALKEQEERLQQIDKETKNGQQQVAKLEKVIAQLSPLAQNHDKPIILAALLLLWTDSEATYLFGGSYSDYQKFSAPFLLQYEAMLQTLTQAIPTYNFLGITGNFDGTDGVLRFKQNFNGYITRKMGTFRYYPNPLKYKLIQSLKTFVYRFTNRKAQS